MPERKKFANILFMKFNINLQKLIIVFCCLFFLFLVTLGFFSVASPDDFWHGLFIAKKGKSFSTPFVWSLSQFFQWSGRVVVNFLVALFTVKPLHTNYISAFYAFIFFSSLTFMFANDYKRFEENRLSRLIFASVQILIVFIFTYSVLGEAVYLGSTPFVWAFLFFVLARAVLQSDFLSRHSWVKYVAFYILGNSIEFLILPGLFLLWKAKRENSINHFWRVLAAFLAGVCLNIFSPGVFPHLRMAISSISLHPMDQLYHVQIVFTKFTSLLGLKVLFAIPLCLLFHVNGTMNLEDFRKKMSDEFLLALASVFILVPSAGPAADAAYFYFLIFFASAFFWTVQYFKRRFLQLAVPEIVQQLVVLLSLMGACQVIGVNIVDATQVRSTFVAQQEIISSVAATEKHLISARYKTPMKNHILFYSDLTSDPENAMNSAQTDYYELDQIVAQ